MGKVFTLASTAFLDVKKHAEEAIPAQCRRGVDHSEHGKYSAKHVLSWRPRGVPGSFRKKRFAIGQGH